MWRIIGLAEHVRGESRAEHGFCFVRKCLQFHFYHRTSTPIGASHVAGIGGAATAHYVRQLVGEDVAIHVFEQSRVGGRLRSSVTFEGRTHELGGSMVRNISYCASQHSLHWIDEPNRISNIYSRKTARYRQRQQ